MKWWNVLDQHNLSEVKRKSSVAKQKAWKTFLDRFPKADKSRFVAETRFDDKFNAIAKVFFKESDSSYHSVFGSDRQYWSEEMKKALGLMGVGGFPYQLSPLGSKVFLSIPTVPFGGKAPSLKKIFNAETKIYVTPDEYFTTKFRQIFQKTKLRYTSAAESKLSLAGPNMKY